MAEIQTACTGLGCIKEEVNTFPAVAAYPLPVSYLPLLPMQSTPTPASPTSPALETFRQKFFGSIDQYLAWHDGYDWFTDKQALDALSSEERLVAEEELLAALQARTADPRAIIGLGHLRSHRALPTLHAYLASAGTYALKAIANIDASQLNQEQLASLLVLDSSEYQLIDLLMGLHTYFRLSQLQPIIPQRVVQLLLHPAYLARYHALSALRVLYHLPQADWNPRQDTVFGLITSDAKPAQHRRAQQIIQAQIAASQSTASSAGL